MEEAADYEKVPRTVVVEDVTGQRTAREHEERLDRRDPCDSTRRILGQRVFQIVRREYSDTVDPSANVLLVNKYHKPRSTPIWWTVTLTPKS